VTDTFAFWKKLSFAEIRDRIRQSLAGNVNFKNQTILGIPVSHLDEHVFSQDSQLLENAAFLQAMVANPNHIGCHTLGRSEKFFAGSQQLEKEAIDIIGCDILGGDVEAIDGYIASGGTEANLQAIWIYRNYYQREKRADLSQIAIICSVDSHYSMPKAANILGLDIIEVQVNEENRKLSELDLKEKIAAARESGVLYFIVVSNLMTTMFGSIDNVDLYVDCLEQNEVDYKIHIDGAYGGFLYPFSNLEPGISFKNPAITSFTLDAHKLLQAPFGTGVFVIRKNWMSYAMTDQARYVEGADNTVIGSRSGANAIAVWMILMTYGPHGWYEKTHLLMHRTDWLSNRLNDIGISHYRHPLSNIVTIRANQLSNELVEKYGLVPDNHQEPAWYKLVVMNHVTIDLLEPFVAALKNSGQ
jgi:tyrosine decarboxylase / aspartate 1-decarboxylase